MKKVEGLKTFIHKLSAIPYISSRYGYRLANHFLSMEEAEVDAYFSSLIEARKKLTKCVVCCGWFDQESDCVWCMGDRDKTLICVVETWIDAVAIDRSGTYKGVFHILEGALSPLDGVMPENLSYNILLQRISKSDSCEVIIATNQTPEGSATGSYLVRLLESDEYSHASISQLSSGIPVGGSLEFTDKITLGKSFAYRRSLK